MIFWTVKWIFISFTLIFLAHYLFIFFTNTLTVPKVKDLVNKPNACYSELLAAKPMPKQQMPKQQSNMQDELNTFLRDLKRP
jgi:hypothetical protein